MWPRLRGWINKFNGACHVAKRDKFRASDSHLKQCRREYTPFVTRCFCFTLLFIRAPPQPPPSTPSFLSHSRLLHSRILYPPTPSIVRPNRPADRPTNQPTAAAGWLLPSIAAPCTLCPIHDSFFIAIKMQLRRFDKARITEALVPLSGFHPPTTLTQPRPDIGRRDGWDNRLGCYSRKNCHLLVRRAGVTREICRLPMARNKSAIIVAGSRFNCYTPSIDFTINIFGHPVSLASLRYCYYYYFLSPFFSFFLLFSSVRSKNVLSPGKGKWEEEDASTRFLLLSVVFTRLRTRGENLFNCQTEERKRWFNSSKLV